MSKTLLLVSCLIVFVTSKLIWSDEFRTFNTTRWKHYITPPGTFNGEFQYYVDVRKNSYAENGHLYLRPTVETRRFKKRCKTLSCKKKINDKTFIHSVRMSTEHSFSFKYGRVEMMVKMPRGNWLWPAIWLYPKKPTYGEWPRSGEIDLAELRANTNFGEKKGIYQTTSALNWGVNWIENLYFLTYGTLSRTKEEGDYSSKFFNYTLVWKKEHIEHLIDGKQILFVNHNISYWERGGWERNKPNETNPWEGRGNDAPFDHEYFFVINIAVGGTNGFWADNLPDKPWKNFEGNPLEDFIKARNTWEKSWTDPMVIDYIRVYDE